jgi:hypothetical protein
MSTSDGLLEQYKAYIEDIGRIGERYESSKNYYVSLLSALFTFLALAGGDSAVFKLAAKFLWLISGVGVVICLMWIAHTLSVNALFKVKFRILTELEEQASLYPAFKLESQWLFQPASRPENLVIRQYVGTTRCNLGVAGAFMFLFALLPFL